MNPSEPTVGLSFTITLDKDQNDVDVVKMGKTGGSDEVAFAIDPQGMQIILNSSAGALVAIDFEIGDVSPNTMAWIGAIGWCCQALPGDLWHRFQLSGGDTNTAGMGWECLPNRQGRPTTLRVTCNNDSPAHTEYTIRLAVSVTNEEGQQSVWILDPKIYNDGSKG